MGVTTMSRTAQAGEAPVPDWRRVAELLLLSRALDHIEESELVPGGLVTYQFSARGHELPQILLGLALSHPRDAGSVYYRSRPFVITCGLTATEALAATMGRVGGPNGGRDIGVVHSLTPRGGPTVLPMSGDVGAQYTPAVGWASAIRYRVKVMGDTAWDGAVAAVLGGDGSTITPGFWAALNIATTLRLPMVFLVEDNGYAISVPSVFQTPGGNIARNLASFEGLDLQDGDGTKPEEVARLVDRAVRHARSGSGPALVRVSVPRLEGHSYADNQAYKPAQEVAAEEARDPLPRLRDYLVAKHLSAAEWDGLAETARAAAAAAAAEAAAQSPGDPETAMRGVYFEGVAPVVGGTRPEDAGLPQAPLGEATPEPARGNMIEGIRRTLAHEMRASKRVLVFGEDVGAKGGVHGATRDLMSEFGHERVFDTALTEEGIIGRATGIALAGLVPVPEIQFRKYADPATEQLNDLGTLRWRTNGRFAAPVVVRIPVGFSRATGDPWHSVSGEAVFAHAVGWRVAMPSTASDAVGLLRTALRGDDPTYFLEHRALYDGAAARQPYPGDDYLLPFGEASVVQPGDTLTVVTWGAFVHMAVEATRGLEGVEILDLRTLVPWDAERVLASVRRTGRCLVAHEDTLTAGFGAEVAAVVADQAFTWLDAPVKRVAALDCPVPYSREQIDGVVPSVAALRTAIEDLLAY